MPEFKLSKKFNAPARVRADTLNVAPALLGRPLASPARRAWAIGIDGLVVTLLSSTGWFWLLAGIAGLALELRKKTTRPFWRGNSWLWLALLVLTLLAAQKLGDFVQPEKAPMPTLEIPEAQSPESIAEQADAREQSEAERIVELEDKLAAALKPKPFQWRAEMSNWGQSLGLGFGWAAAYFIFLPYWWQGQTLGKRLLGLRVVELTGKPLSLLDCLGRYGGYAAGMATGMFGFIQVLWDVNRQAIQDKIAHTVVLDLRPALQPAPRTEKSAASA